MIDQMQKEIEDIGKEIEEMEYEKGAAFAQEWKRLRAELETLRAKLNRSLNALRVIDSDCRKCFAKGFEFDIESTRDYIAIVLKEIEETK